MQREQTAWDGAGGASPSEAGVGVVVAEGHRLHREVLAALLRGTSGVGLVVEAATVAEAVEVCRRRSLGVVVWGEGPSGAPKELAGAVPGLRVLVLSDETVEGEENAPSLGRDDRIEQVHSLERLVALTGRRTEVGAPHARPMRVGGPAGAPDPLPALVTPLTPREIQVLEVLAFGRCTEEGARALHISPLTLRSHVKSILVKLGAHSKLEAVSLALRCGLIRLPTAG